MVGGGKLRQLIIAWKKFNFAVEEVLALQGPHESRMIAETPHSIPLNNRKGLTLHVVVVQDEVADCSPSAPMAQI